LYIDGAKEFQSEEIVDYCAENGVVLQLVVANNHTIQARVEGATAAGCIKQHSRTSLLHAGKPTRFWDDASKGFGIKKVFLWASPDARGKPRPHAAGFLRHLQTYCHTFWMSNHRPIAS